ncbi:hypothetical protein PoMZ_01761 [Pyricularia oryzae]|uniref:Uncharacterized protein n=1 Tax=Pyricularia oryzae TaxID=318829 RepID=A0A4P7N9M3_PYROR|nr:hypothetical protein PoMZ_01761 [Pyricularia oryzae]
MQFNFVAITVALIITSCAAQGIVNKDCRTLLQGQTQVCRDKARPVLCDGNDFLGAFGGCCPDNGCGINVSLIYI